MSPLPVNFQVVGICQRLRAFVASHAKGVVQLVEQRPMQKRCAEAIRDSSVAVLSAAVSSTVVFSGSVGIRILKDFFPPGTDDLL